MLDVHSYMARQAGTDGACPLQAGHELVCHYHQHLKAANPDLMPCRLHTFAKYLPAYMRHFILCAVCAVLLLSCVQIFVTLWIVASQAPSVHRILFYSPSLNFLALIWIFFILFSFSNLLPCVYL